MGRKEFAEFKDVLKDFYITQVLRLILNKSTRLNFRNYFQRKMIMRVILRNKQNLSDLKNVGKHLAPQRRFVVLTKQYNRLVHQLKYDKTTKYNHQI